MQFELPSRRDVKKCVVTRETVEQGHAAHARHRGRRPTTASSARPSRRSGPMLPGALRVPIVQAPLAGGASTPALDRGGRARPAASASSPPATRRPTRCAPTSRATRELTARAVRRQRLRARPRRRRGRSYAALHRGAARRGRAPGRRARRAALRRRRLGGEARRCSRPTRWPSSRSPSAARRADVVERLQAAGSSGLGHGDRRRRGARRAAAAGADALVVRASRRAGTAASFVDARAPATRPAGAAAARRRAPSTCRSSPPAGSPPGGAVAAVLAAGAQAAQLGTAFMRCPEAGTAARAPGGARGRRRRPRLTRAFTGRSARGIVNRFLREHADARAAAPIPRSTTSPRRCAPPRAPPATPT